MEKSQNLYINYYYELKLILYVNFEPYDILCKQKKRLELAFADSRRISCKAPPGFEPGIEVLQTFALPLGYGAKI